MILEIIKYPNELLKTISMPIKQIDNDVRQLAIDMEETMIVNNGLGLSAIQVSQPVRMICILNSDLNNLIDATQYPVCFMINPVIIDKSEKTIKATEGCLSFGNLRVRIRRPEEVRIRYYDLEGNQKTVKLTGIHARCVFHELDHLEGVTLNDYSQ